MYRATRRFSTESFWFSLLLAVVLLLLPPAMAARGTVEGIEYRGAKNSFVLKSSTALQASLATLDVDGNRRLILDVEDAEIGFGVPRDAVLLKELQAQWPAVRGVSVNQFGGTRPVVRIVIDLQGDRYTTQLTTARGPLIELKALPVTATATVPPQQVYAPPSSAYPLPQAAAPAQSQATIEDLRRQLAEKQSLLDQAAARLVMVDSLQARLAEASEHHRQTQERLALAESANRDLQRRIEKQAGKPLLPDPALEDMKKTVVVLNRRNDDLVRENQELRQQVERTRRYEGSVGNAEMQEVRKQLEQAKTALASSIKTINAQNSEISGLKDRLSQVQGGLDVSAREQLTILNSKLEEREAEVAHLKKALAEKSISPGLASAEKQALEARVAELSAEAQALKTQAHTLESKLRQKEIVVANLHRQIQESQAEGLGRKLEDTQKSLKLAQEANSRLKAADESNRQQIQMLEAQLAEERHAVQTLKSAANDPAIEDMKKTLVVLHRKHEELVQENQALRQSMDRQARTHQEALNSQQEANKALEVQINDLMVKYQKAAAEASELRAKKPPAPPDVRTQPEYIHLQTELASLRQQLTSAQGEAGRAKTLEGQLQALNTQYEKALADVAELRGKTSPAPPDVRTQPEYIHLQTELASLRQQLTSAQDEAGRAKTLEGQLQALNTQYEKALADVAEWRGKTSPAPPDVRTQPEYIRLQKERDTLAEQVSTLQKNADSLKKSRQPEAERVPVDAEDKAQVARLKKELAETVTHLDKITRERDKLVQSLAKHKMSGKQKSSSKEDRIENRLTQRLEEAQALEQQERFDEALTTYRALYAEAPDSVPVVLALTSALMNEDQLGEAASILALYAGNHPSSVEIFNQLGKVYLLDGRLELAEQAFSRAIPVNVLNNYASTLKKLNRHAEAERMLKLALTLNPDDTELLFNLGNLYSASDNLEQARTTYQQALDVRPDFAPAHFNLGLVYSRLGNKVKAIEHLERFLNLSPASDNVEAIRAYLQKLKS